MTKADAKQKKYLNYPKYLTTFYMQIFKFFSCGRIFRNIETVDWQWKWQGQNCLGCNLILHKLADWPIRSLFVLKHQHWALCHPKWEDIQVNGHARMVLNRSMIHGRG